MKNILGHRSWTKSEIIEMLRTTHNFTMCSLPHYRYARVQSACADLKRRGLIEKRGKTATGINYAPTALFNQWAEEVEACVTPLGLIEWHKEYKRSKV